MLDVPPPTNNEYCSKLYTRTTGDPKVLDVPTPTNSDKLQTRENYYHPGQSREMSHRRTGHSKEVAEYCSKLYIHTTTGDPKVLDVPPPIRSDSKTILREKVEAAVKSQKNGKLAGVDNIPSELVQAEGEAMIGMLLITCN